MLTKIKRMICAALACVMALSLSAFPASAQDKTEKPRNEMQFIVSDDLQGYIDYLLADAEHMVHVMESVFESNEMEVQSIAIGYPIQIHNSDYVFFPVMDENGRFVWALEISYNSEKDRFYGNTWGNAAADLNELERGGTYMYVADEYYNIYVVEDGEYALSEPGLGVRPETAEIDDAKAEMILEFYNNAVNPVASSTDSADIATVTRTYNIMEPLVTSDFDTITITDAPEAEEFSGTFSQSYAAVSKTLYNFVPPAWSPEDPPKSIHKPKCSVASRSFHDPFPY